MRRIKSITIVVAVCAFSLSCITTEKVGHRYIKIINFSNVDLTCQELWKGLISEQDTIFTCHLLSNYIIPVDSSVLIVGGTARNCGWECDFEVIPCIQFIFMEKERFDYYYYYGVKDESRCDSVRKNVPILQRYRLKLEDLQKLDWTVPYPPTEAMKDMDIYPPYKDIEDY